MGMRKIHYGWVICVTCTLLLFVTMGTVSNGFSIYLPYIMAERGLTHAQTSSLVTLRCLVAFVAMLLIGGYYRKVSLRVGTGLAVCCAGLAFWLYSAAETYPLFCVGAAVSGISYGLGSMIPVSILINRWFDQHRALALSICASGSGIATIVLPPVTTHLVERFSMSAAFRMGGAAILVCAGVVLLAGHLLCWLAFVQSTALSVVNVLCLGLGYPIATMGPSVWSNDLAAPEQYPVVVRRLQVIYAGGALLFASLPGLLADRLGGYIPAYLLFSAIIALTLLCIALAYRSGGGDR